MSDGKGPQPSALGVKVAATNFVSLTGREAGPMRQFHGRPRLASEISREAVASTTTRAPVGTMLTLAHSVLRRPRTKWVRR